MSNNHVIHRQVFEVDFPTRAEALDGQNRLNEMYIRDLLPMLNELFSDVSRFEHLLIDKLVVDLGTLSGTDLEKQILQKLNTELRDELLKEVQISRRRKAVNGQILKRSSDTVTGSEDSKETSTSSSKKDIVYDFQFFIDHGRFPWWSAENTPSELAGELIRDHPERFLSLIEGIYSSEKKRSRFIYQLSDEILLEIIQTVTSKSHVTKTIIKLLDDLMVVQGKHRFITLNRSGLRLIFWETALEFLVLGPALSRGKTETAPQKSSSDIFPASFQSLTTRQQFMAVLLGRLGRYATNTVGRKTDPKERRGSVLNLFLTLQKQVKKDGLSNRPLAKLLASLPSGLLPSPDQDKFNRTQADIQNGTAGMKITDSSLYKSSESNSRAADEADDSFEIYNAGLVVLAQFLPLFFDALGLLQDKSFPTEQSAVRGAQVLQFICTGSTEMPEQDMILNKILCGLPIDTPLPGTLHISNYEKEEVDNLLASVIEHWKALKGTSAKGLRQTFLNRTGMIKIENNGWSIFIERTTVDVLLDHLPWSISIIKLPWNDKFIHVEW